MSRFVGNLHRLSADATETRNSQQIDFQILIKTAYPKGSEWINLGLFILTYLLVYSFLSISANCFLTASTFGLLTLLT